MELREWPGVSLFVNLLPSCFHKFLPLFLFLAVALAGCSTWPGVDLRLDTHSGPQLVISFSVTPSTAPTNLPTLGDSLTKRSANP